MQRHLHHIPDEHFAGQAAGTSSMNDTGLSNLPGQYHLFRSDGQKAGVSIGRAREESNVV
jgi:hypothetical protein